FCLADFEAYEAQRNEFLQSAQGRAALTAGNLLWRLACSAASNQDVLDGPSVEALQGGRKSFIISDPTCTEAMWDNSLTEEEINLITGTYEVPTGRYTYLYFGNVSISCF
ncbi:hypothetical protein GYMLUDRAFT_160993, partial [Collybiopsis luxurians FD-317 M1]